jgi:flagellar biosynthesis/type III secretory pathway protein FliH
LSAETVVKPARFPSFPELEERDPLLTRPRSAAEEAEAVREAARCEGLAHGRQEGRAAALADWAPRLTALASALEEAITVARAERERLAAELVETVPHVAVQLARKVIERELADGEDAVRAAVAAVARRLAQGGGSIVRVAPDVAQALDAWRGEGDQAAAALAGVVIQADEGLRPGEWMIETEGGVLDGRLATQLEEAARILTEADA